MKEHVLHNLGFNLGYLKMLLKDIPEERMAEQPAGVFNHPAWQIGHISVVLDGAAGLLGGEKKQGEAEQKQYGFGSEPTADREQYASKDELMAGLEDAQGRLAAALAGASAEQLGSANPVEMLRDLLPTTGDMVTFMATSHYGNHLGQLGMWRRAAGFPFAISAT